MTTTRRVLHHAGWFALLGPLAGIPVAMIAIVAIALQYHDFPDRFLWQIAIILPIVTWLVGATPALLAGIAVACLPAEIYAFHYRRILASAAIGLVISVAITLSSVLFFTDKNLMHFILREEIFWVIAGAGLLAGVVMGWLIPYLPGMKSKENA
ncbi:MULTISPECIES: hypothetical protein [unclassified Klebsiella]|uniref:hypothetical protein n=1 Tax=unclassified Klebsiella TaxID=2608929 RepID=UPI001D19590B|nr:MULTISPECIES: hypothetical protein [unclassified Klebsiella]